MANESSGKKALKAGLGYTVGNMLVKGLSFLAIPLFARLMTVEDFGIYSTFSSYVMIMTVLAGFTLHTSVRNAKLDYVDLTGSYCSSVTLLVIGNSLLLLALSLVFAAPLARSLSLEQPYLPALIVLESFGMAMLTFYNSVLSVDYKYKEYLVLSLVYAVAGIGGSVLLILTLCRGQGYLGRILGTLIPAVLVGIYVVFRLWRKDRPRISREYWRYGMAISLPTVPHGLSQLLLNQFDRIMIKSIIGSTEAGLYSFAYNVGMIFQVITNSMDTAWAPWFFEKMKAKEYPAIRRAASAYVVFVSIGAMALALISPEVILIAGGSGAGKTRTYGVPNVLECACSMVITDPKAEILRKTGNLLKQKGYEVIVFDLINPAASFCYNPFVYVHDDREVLTLIENLIQNTTPSHSKSSDPFWEKSETALLQALMLYLLHEAPPEEQNFPMVMEMIAAAEVHEDDDNYQSPLDILFERLEMREPDSIACKQYRIFKQAAGKTAKSILVSVGVRLAAFNLPSIAKLTMTDELHLQELGERKIALFCCIPDSDKSLNYLVGMIYTQLIQTLYRQADRVHKGRLPVPVHCLMDEYANISLPKDTFLSALATMRSRAIFCSIIVQNMAQLKAMYKDDWESLVGLCDEFLYLGGTEKETHKYVSELLGKETISTTSYNQSKGRSGSYSINHQQSGRDLMTPDEVRLLDNSKCILFIRGERPVVDYKYNLLKHPNIRCTEDGGAALYDYTAADNALDDLPGAPENYELLDMDDFLPAEAAEMKPTIQRIRRPK